eukprot:844006-Alexandrium_andersonii.AAC.1
MVQSPKSSLTACGAACVYVAASRFQCGSVGRVLLPGARLLVRAPVVVRLFLRGSAWPGPDRRSTRTRL